jgi:hypothetical protein
MRATYDHSKTLILVQDIVNTLVHVQAQEVMTALNDALQRIFTPHFFPEDLSILPSFVDTIRHLSFPILGFNEQVVRATVFLRTLNLLGCDAFVETGTSRGDTSLLIAAQTMLPIFSCELSKKTYGHASALLHPFGERVRITLGDSRSFLRQFLNSSRFRCPFFYLDAHWNADIPLLQELELILSRSENFIVVIDDFRVPADSGFKYDMYGTISFDLPYIAPVLRTHANEVWVLYPSYPSELETGARRGFIVIIPRATGSKLASAIGSAFLSQPFRVV